MNLIFKETNDLDYDAVVDIFFEVGFLKNKDKKLVYKRAIEKAFRNSQYVISIWNGVEMIGFARVLTDKSLFATIWNMIVVPRYQKKGIGKKLLKKCLDKYPGLHHFLIADHDVVEFYKKMGFNLHPHGMFLEKGKKVCIIYN
ncbi:GNAT family N-acetyltransferase [Patescibacteria group bacterium]